VGCGLRVQGLGVKGHQVQGLRCRDKVSTHAMAPWQYVASQRLRQITDDEGWGCGRLRGAEGVVLTGVGSCSRAGTGLGAEDRHNVSDENEGHCDRMDGGAL